MIASRARTLLAELESRAFHAGQASAWLPGRGQLTVEWRGPWSDTDVVWRYRLNGNEIDAEQASRLFEVTK